MNRFKRAPDLYQTSALLYTVFSVLFQPSFISLCCGLLCPLIPFIPDGILLFRMQAA